MAPPMRGRARTARQPNKASKFVPGLSKVGKSEGVMNAKERWQARSGWQKTRLLGVLLLTTILVGTGLYEVGRDSANPAAWLLLYMYSLPFVFLWYFETVDVPPGEAASRRAYMVGAMLVSVFALAFSLLAVQVQGWLTWVVWGVIVFVLWMAASVLLNFALDGVILHHAKKHVKNAANALGR